MFCCFSTAAAGADGGTGQRKQAPRQKAPKIPEELLRPHGNWDYQRVDLKRLRKFIKDGRLAPCYPGVEDSSSPEVRGSGTGSEPSDIAHSVPYSYAANAAHLTRRRTGGVGHSVTAALNIVSVDARRLYVCCGGH